MPVTPHQLDGGDREQAWQRITAAKPRYTQYQRKTDREYAIPQVHAIVIDLLDGC